MRSRRFSDKGRIALIAVAVLVVGVLLFGRFFAGFYTDYLWFDSVGRAGVFSTMLRSKLLLFVLFGGIFVALAVLNLVIADRLAPSAFSANTHPVVERFHEFFGHRLRSFRIAVATVAGLLFAAPAVGHWQDWLMFRNSQLFGIADAQFGHDVGFYMFRLPFIAFVLDWLFAALVFITLLVIATHVLSGGIIIQPPRPKVRRATKAHVAVLLAVLAVLKAGDYWLTRYELTTDSRGFVRGLLYSAAKAQLPAVVLLTMIALLVAGLFLSTLRTNSWRIPVVASALWAVIALIGGIIYPAAIQALVVNPNRLDEGEGAAFGHLAAVGVAWLLGAALIRRLRDDGYFASRPEPRLLELLDIVALGTVADVAQLRGLNRAFVAQGLKIMAGRHNVGLDALITASRLKRAPICSDLGFALGPRINAGGRVGKSDLGVRLLTTNDPDEARGIAEELDQLNNDRRAIEAGVQGEAEAAAIGQGNRAVAVVSGSGWHPGVIGIVAGRLKEKFDRPAIVIAVDGEGVGKGSGRSVSGVDLGAAVLAAKDAGLLVAGGGHAMAAGLTIDANRIDAFADFLEERLAADVARSGGDRNLLLDAVVATGGVTPALVDALEGAGPYGMGWPAPRIAAGPMRVVKADIVGTNHVRAVMAGDDGRSLKTVAFRQAETALGQALLGAGRDRRLWVAGRARIDDWGARPAAELHIDDIAFAD